MRPKWRRRTRCSRCDQGNRPECAARGGLGVFRRAGASRCMALLRRADVFPHGARRWHCRARKLRVCREGGRGHNACAQNKRLCAYDAFCRQKHAHVPVEEKLAFRKRECERRKRGKRFEGFFRYEARRSLAYMEALLRDGDGVEGRYAWPIAVVDVEPLVQKPAKRGGGMRQGWGKGWASACAYAFATPTTCSVSPSTVKAMSCVAKAKW